MEFREHLVKGHNITDVWAVATLMNRLIEKETQISCHIDALKKLSDKVHGLNDKLDWILEQKKWTR